MLVFMHVQWECSLSPVLVCFVEFILEYWLQLPLHFVRDLFIYLFFNRLRNIRYCFNTIVLIAVWRVLIARSELARNLWYLIIGLMNRFVKFFRLTSTIHKQWENPRITWATTDDPFMEGIVQFSQIPLYLLYMYL